MALIQLKFDFIEAFFYDIRIRLRPSPTLSDEVRIIMVDSKTIEKNKGIPGFPEHAELLSKLKTAKPKAVIYIRGFAPLRGIENQYGEEDRRGFFVGDDSSKARFAQAAKGLQNFGMQTDVMERHAEESKLSLSPPLDEISVYSGPKTADKNILAKDGVSRRLLVTYQNQKLMHPEIASLFNSDLQNIENIKGRLNLFDSEQVYIDFAKPGSFAISKFEDIQNGNFDPGLFENKLVLIGDDIGASAKDYVSTPFSRDANMTLTELHANMFETLIRNSAPQPSPNWVNILLTSIIAILTINVVLTLRPLFGLLILGSTALSFTVISLLLFWPFGVWIGMAHPFLAIFLCYYFFIPYRLIIENRRSWELFQKHQLLSQVEELKTNFISMMSHDLKTPIARIQGMTDLILKDTVTLSSHQREAIDTIRSSSSDLLSFINSILNYARIESQGVELHKQSKDINQLLQEVIKRHEFLAKVKHMKIVTDLEPMFSISLDPDLMKQVFSNLLENAIKYSPEHSQVQIKSSEVDGVVKIDFIDQGPGIPEDELPHVFMKFFRSKNAKSSPVKGSGLGLYLAKYFVELHKGQIIVTSLSGKGSCFTVELPTS
ncbi:MAG: hypothetical protein BroJett040_14110 [Oligoflexia bacterium]|nr:MAG: hypothetical protein BroJett040_14110 [Oligoflexia bacterium]